MRITALCFLGAAALAIGAGCGSATPGSSTISGTIDQSSFPEAVQSIAVLSDSSAPTSAPVAADGSFTLTLQEGASYRFTLGADDTIPLILRDADDRLQTSVTITGGGASVNIGSVRYWGGSGSVGSSDTTSVVAVPGADTTATDSCVDGVMPRTNQPCSTGEATVTCEDMGGHDGMDHHHHGMHAGPPPPDQDVVVSDPATDASREQAVAIPERTLATGVGCGGCPGM